MQVTIDIPDETAARMLDAGKDPAIALLELAGYAACASGRISEFELGRLLGLDSRFDVHAVMARLQMEAEASDAEFLRQESATLDRLAELEKVAAAR